MTPARVAAFFAVALLGLVAFCGSAQSADLPRAREPEVKAAYLFNFGIFTEWPETKFSGADAPFVIGVIGNTEVAGELEKFAQQKPIGRRKVAVRRLKTSDDLTQCHILFVGADVASETVISALRAAGSKADGILTVGETGGFLEQGGMINFVLVGNNLKYEMSPSVAEKAGLKVSAQVLRLAINVLNHPQGRGGRG